MLDGICPKCGSQEVYSGASMPNKSGNYGANTIPIKGGKFLVSAAPLDNYVCAQCGYVESYISDQQQLDEIVQNWSKVQT